MDTIEEKKIALEEKRLDLELQRFELEKAQIAEEGKHKKKKIDPINATIIVALIGFFATAVGTMVNNANVNNLEARKFEFDLIKKGLEQPTESERIKFLHFISTLKLVTNHDLSKALDSAVAKPENVPNLSTVGPPITAPLGTQPIDISPNITESDFRIGALNAARGEIGHLEDTTFINAGPYVKKYMRGGQGYEWSVGFISWCYSQNTSHHPPFDYVYDVEALKKQLIDRGWYKKASECKPRPGDIFFNEFGGRLYAGIVDSVKSDNTLIVIRGNTVRMGDAAFDGRGYGVFPRRFHIFAHTCFGQIK